MNYVWTPGWKLSLMISLLFSLVMGLCLVWLSIERTDMAFALRTLHAQVEEHSMLQNKLEVERDKLLAPAVLSRKAAILGMRAAKPGQIRKIEQVEQ